MANADGTVMVDGSISFDGGVDSLKPTTIASQQNKNGLQRNQLAWLINGTVRDGGISPRAGWQPVCQVLTSAVLANILAGTAGYQGGFMYQPQGADPYLIFSFAGDIYKVDPQTKVVTNLSMAFNLHNPPTADHGYFEQGEQFLVIQAGDGKTLPLFWDGTTLRRSNGIIANPIAASFTVVLKNLTNPNVGSTISPTATYTGPLNPNFTPFVVPAIGANVTVTLASSFKGNVGDTFAAGNGNFQVVSFVNQDPKVSELPAALAMVYYMQRIWYVLPDQRSYTAGDIVGNTGSGTQAYNFTDSILKVTENPLAIGGDGFHLPSNAGTIRALSYNANVDASLGQGRLLIFTRKQVYALTVPITRTEWIAANSNTQPLQTVVQIANGAAGDRSIVRQNGDVYYQSLEPGVRSLIAATRFFDQPGNTPISSPENRIIQFDDRSLLSFGSGIEFDNRLFETALPKRVPQGVVHGAVMPLDFTPLSEPASTQPPVWEGHYEGLDFLQMFTGDFGGLQRAFAFVVSRTDGSIWLWELTQGSLTENGDNRITWQIEFPAFTWGQEFDLKRLTGGEIWIDRMSGRVDFQIDYRQDGSACWNKWFAWDECSARNCNENIPPNCVPQVYPYPAATAQGLGYRQTRGLPKPPVNCDKQMRRPSDTAHQFQPRLTIHGSCRVRGIFLHATKVDRKTYADLPC
jgi:hypothetical protein